MNVTSIGIGVALFAAAGLFIVISYFSTDLDRCISEKELDIKCAQRFIQQALESNSAASLMSTFQQDYTYHCHQLGHLVGREVFKRSKTLDGAVAQCPAIDCKTACIHGATIQALESLPGFSEALTHPSADVLRFEAQELCKTRELCHGVGHATHGLFQALQPALEACDTYVSGIAVEDCYSGVFMEHNRSDLIFSESEHETDALYPCSSVAPQYRRACYYYVYLRQDLLFSEQNMAIDEQTERKVRACETLTLPDRTLCTTGVGWSLIRNYAVDEAAQQCGRFQSVDDRRSCVSGVAAMFTSQGTSHRSTVAACSALDEAVAQSCFDAFFHGIESRNEPLENVCEGSQLCERALTSYQTKSETAVINLP